MAAVSDQLLVYAILGYALAMLAYAVEYAFGSRTFVSRIALRELVSVGGPASSAPDPAPVSPAPAGTGSGAAGSGAAASNGSASAGSASDGPASAGPGPASDG